MRATRTLLAAAAALLPIASSAMDITAKSAIIIDGGSGKILWQREADTPRYPASTTKIMTGLLLLEHCPPDEIITAPGDVNAVKEASMHLKPYEQVSVEHMLYALMLRSANDGAYAIALHVAGSVPAFAQMMNERARQIGCTNTHFHNPNGLNDPEHWTTAHDLALMGREAMKYEKFREVVRTQKYIIDRSINIKDRTMVNHDHWLHKDVTAEGIKTGYTIPAGRCFVGSATRNGYRVITTVMKSGNWQKDNQQMVDWAFKNFEKKVDIKAGQVVGQLPVAGGTSETVAVTAKNDAYAIDRKTAGPVSQTMDISEVSAPVQEGQVVGNLVLRDSDGFEQRVPVVAVSAVSMAPAAAIAKGTANGSAVFLGSILFLGAYVVRGKSRRFINGSKN